MTMTNNWIKSAFYSLHSSVNNIKIQIFDQNKRPVKVPLGNARPDNKKFTSKSLQVTKHWPIRHKFQNNAIYNGTFRHLGYPISQELTDSNTQGTRDVAVDKSVNILDRWRTQILTRMATRKLHSIYQDRWWVSGPDDIIQTTMVGMFYWDW